MNDGEKMLDDLERQRLMSAQVNGRIPITESDKVHEAWYVEAKEVRTPEDLAAFATRMREDYQHDYGTICHAAAACAIAAAWCINRGPTGGITGFQAGAIFWEFYRYWLHEDGPARLIKYDDLLYPQYEYKFGKTIDKSTWEWVQAEARKKLDDDGDHAHVNVVRHWRSIVAGRVPFGLSVVER